MSYTLKDINLNAKKTAFLLVDYQNFFVEPGCPLEAEGAADACDSINAFATKLQEMGGLVIYTLQSHDYMKHYFYYKKWPQHFPNGVPILRRGTREFEPYHELTVKPDFIIEKDRWSAFYETNLDLILKNFDIETVVLGGCTTSVCTEATARDAVTRGYDGVMISDYCFGFNKLIKDGSLANWDLAWGIVATSDEVMDEVVNQTQK